jgi:ATP-dependent Clp endopeptidase proteolytic subunit ClpP
MSEELEQADLVKSESKKVVTVDPLTFNTIGLMGDVTEENANELVFSLLLLDEKLTSEYIASILSMPEKELESLTEEQLAELKPNIDLYISTNGGSADDMFAIYDIMRKIKNDKVTSITTYGLGKVMSAGVLLLAAGTKGKRMIGRNCRVMVHSVIGGTAGPMHQLENEFAEVKKIQDNYIQALVAETNMTEKEFRKLLKRKTNIYLSAEEAIELGIADEIF